MTKVMAGAVTLISLALFAPVSAVRAEHEEADGERANGYSIVATPSPVPTSPYGLRPTYRRSHSKRQDRNPELGDEAASTEEDQKSKEEQELDEVFGQ